MKRDKARIKPFCDQLAQLWETHGPDLRFGQIISCLPLSIDRPGHDPFFVEEDEMLEALQRTFSQEGKAARTLDAEQLDSLKDRWEDRIGPKTGPRPAMFSSWIRNTLVGLIST